MSIEFFGFILPLDIVIGVVGIILAVSWALGIISVIWGWRKRRKPRVYEPPIRRPRLPPHKDAEYLSGRQIVREQITARLGFIGYGGEVPTYSLAMLNPSRFAREENSREARKWRFAHEGVRLMLGEVEPSVRFSVGMPIRPNDVRLVAC